MATFAFAFAREALGFPIEGNDCGDRPHHGRRRRRSTNHSLAGCVVSGDATPAEVMSRRENVMKKTLYLTTILAGLTATSMAMAAPAVTSIPVGNGPIDYANAKPMPLPMTPVAPAGVVHALTNGAPATLTPGYDKGGVGNGVMTPAFTPVSKAMADAPVFSSQQFGSANHPFTTARAAVRRDSTTGEFTSTLR